MARSRRGSFGLQPRVAPNVSGQVIALAREYAAKRQQNIMDAWRNGGTFEGKKATDDMVLAFWKGEMKDLDPSDPTYEAAKNQVMQLEYAVEQSKMDLKHIQGKLSDTGYAQFFLKWAKKVPVNSEFYRTLQKDAAGLIERAKATARANGERAKTEAFNAFVKNVTDNQIAIGDAMTKALSDLSQSTGLSIKGNGDELLALLTQNVKANPQQYRYLLDTIHTADPHFDGNLTEGYFAQHIKQATDGYSLIADRAHKAGYVSAYASATQGEASMAEWGQNVKVWPVAQSYTVAENAMLRIWNNPNSSQMDKMAAAAKASAQYLALAQTPGIDVQTKTMLTADAQRLVGQDAGDDPSFGQAQLGRAGVSPEMAMQLGAWTATKAEMDANPTAWAYAPVDQSGQFDPTGRGPLGMVPAGSVQPGAQAVMVPGADGKAVLAMVAPHSVYSSDPNDPSKSPQLVGFQLSYSVGGKTIELWGYKDAQNANHWSLTSPVADGAQTTRDNKGDVYVTPRASAATDPIARATQLDAQFGTHIADQLKAQQAAGAPLGGVTVSQNVIDPKTGRITGTTELKYDNGTFTATQKQNTLDPQTGKVTATQSTPIDIAVATPQGSAFSPSRLAAGEIPGVTYTSPLQASVQAATFSQSQDQISKFAADPWFQQQFLSQTMQTFGTDNIYDPRIAAAWKDLTTPKTGVPPAVSHSAAGRTDVQYPGMQPAAANNASLTVNFGSVGELKLPGLPSYLGNNNINLSPLGDAAKTVQGIMGNILPGLGAPPQMPQGSPAPTATPTPTPAPTSVSPTPVAAPPTAVNPTAPPTATPPKRPDQKPNQSGGYNTWGGGA